MMYRVYAYLFADNKKKLYEMIKSCTMASINNIKWLLKQKNASQLYRKYYDGYIYLGGADYWQEPLSFMFKESLFCELYMDIVPYYEKYVLFLKNYGSGWEDPEWMHEIYKTERDRLITLCDWALEGCDSTIEDLEYSLKIEYAEKAKYERIMLEHYGTDALPKKDTNSMEFY